ncbi:ferritin-like domain-containing protein [Lysobacter arvi]|uniref:Ferritin-like domain-containing protein n=1 Tax=Lysobacter arvi TaxID=3038776 RepID=A0ABU1CAB3_9GAMM|nr:ferritin-like domain-containing protein [Lysobacter arvi]MDR0182143.1 ferritin-like domain-containing protein [Lysobacter arvi]
MQDRIKLGANRTGIASSPMHSEAMLDGLSLQDGSPQPAIGAAELRASYRVDAEPVGSMPPPNTLRGVVGAVGESLKGKRMHILLDKLGERAAYERSGARLYDAFLQRLSAGVDAALPGDMSLELVQTIRNDEVAHFTLLVEAIEKLGGDPTVQTPCADMTAVTGMGLIQAMNEPRATLAQGLQVLMAAELIDVASWELLIALATQLDQAELADRFTAALNAENVHLERVRGWLQGALQNDVALLAPSDGDGE